VVSDEEEEEEETETENKPPTKRARTTSPPRFTLPAKVIQMDDSPIKTNTAIFEIIHFQGKSLVIEFTSYDERRKIIAQLASEVLHNTPSTPRSLDNSFMDAFSSPTPTQVEQLHKEQIQLTSTCKHLTYGCEHRIGCGLDHCNCNNRFFGRIPLHLAVTDFPKRLNKRTKRKNRSKR